MDSYQFNKIAGALLGTLFVILGLSFISDAIFSSHAPEKPGYVIEVEGAGEAHAAVSQDSGPTVEPVASLLASVDLATGKKIAKKCAACHTFDSGGAKKVGPNLYGVVNRAIAAGDGFSYSAALKDYAEGKSWSYAELNGFLYKPKEHVKGTSMSFAGLKKTADRAAMIGYLRSLADEPAPLPSE